MPIELNEGTFRRLVQLYLLLFLLLILVLALEALDPAQQRLDAELQALIGNHFGWTGDKDWVMGATGVLLLAHVTSGIGLLWFRQWARTLFWASIAVLFAFDTVAGAPLSFSGQWATWIDFLGTALFGIIVLLSYASGLGATWFDKRAIALEGK